MAVNLLRMAVRIDSVSELKKIQTPQLEGVIAGKAFYVGDIDLKKADKLLSTNA